MCVPESARLKEGAGRRLTIGVVFQILFPMHTTLHCFPMNLKILCVYILNSFELYHIHLVLNYSALLIYTIYSFLEYCLPCVYYTHIYTHT